MRDGRKTGKEINENIVNGNFVNKIVIYLTLYFCIKFNSNMCDYICIYRP